MKKYIAHREDGTTFEIEWKDRDIPWLLEEKGESDVIAIEREDIVRVSPREFAERVKVKVAQVPHASEELLASDYILAIADVVEELEGTQ